MDEFPWPAIIIGCAIGLPIAFLLWLAPRGADKDRIREYVETRGGKVLDCEWAPFGPGWFFSSERIYAVRYLDNAGNEHQAYGKTSMGTGVSFTGDAIVKQAERSADNPEALAEENRRLRQELDRLKRDDA